MKTESDWAPPLDQGILCSIDGFDRKAADSSQGPNSQPGRLRDRRGFLAWNRPKLKKWPRSLEPRLLCKTTKLTADMQQKRRARQSSATLKTGFVWRRSLHIRTVHAYRHTSFVVLAVGAERFHGYMTAGSSPAWLANAMPSTGFQGAPSVVVTETRTTLWE